MAGELVPFPTSAGSFSSDEAREAAIRVLRLSASERETQAEELQLDFPETILELCQLLDRQIDTNPSKTRSDSEWIYRYLDSNRAIGRFLFDEREYYLGELALVAGTACRLLGERSEASDWFERAGTWFLLTINATADVARVGCQRLMLRIEERAFTEVLAMAPALREVFVRNGAKEQALKCRYLEAASLKEMGRLDEALPCFETLAAEARELGSAKVFSPALVAIIQIYSELGDADRALALAVEAAPILREQNNQVVLAKLHWGLGMLLRSTGRRQEAIATLRSAQGEFQEIGLRADVAALHLVLADLLLDSGQERQAEWEIRAALPVIDELKMVPEGFAAMSLLRESLRRRSIDRQALRKVHGYFEESSS